MKLGDALTLFEEKVGSLANHNLAELYIVAARTLDDPNYTPIVKQMNWSLDESPHGISQERKNQWHDTYRALYMSCGIPMKYLMAFLKEFQEEYRHETMDDLSWTDAMPIISNHPGEEELGRYHWDPESFTEARGLIWFIETEEHVWTPMDISFMEVVTLFESRYGKVDEHSFADVDIFAHRYLYDQD